MRVCFGFDACLMRVFLPQVYLTVLKHGDGATLDTMLKVKSVFMPSWFSEDLFSVSGFTRMT